MASGRLPIVVVTFAGLVSVAAVAQPRVGIFGFSEDFDSVTLPALPAGWTNSGGVGIAAWQTSSVHSDTPPNAALARTGSAAVAGSGVSVQVDTQLVTPNIGINYPMQLIFRRNHNLSLPDAGVLEISYNNGLSWNDIVQAGGRFATGGYNQTVPASSMSPLAGRQAWTGPTGGYSTTRVSLPANTIGDSIRLRFRLATDTNASDNFWYVDTVRMIRRMPISDFDNDGKTDLVVRRCSGAPDCPGIIYVRRSRDAALLAYEWGLSTDAHPWVDYDGDGRTDAADWRAGASAVFHIRRTSNGAYMPVPFGTTGDNAYAVGDYDADGTHDPAVFRPSDGTWYVLRSTAGFLAQPWGLSTDRLTPGDFDGDHLADFGIQRNGVFHTLGSTSGYSTMPWGLSTDAIPPGDYDGDLKTDHTAVRNENGVWVWYIRLSGNGSVLAVAWGAASDFLVPGDYDGDGRMDIATWRPSTGTFYIRRSADGVLESIPWGQAGDVPIASFLVR